MQKTITFIITILIIGLILIGLSKQIANAINSSKRLDSEADEVNKLQVQNMKLHQKLEEVQRYEFVEQMARDKLNMSQSGDTVVIIPESAIEKIMLEDEPVIKVNIPNWQGWLHLFIHS